MVSRRRERALFHAKEVQGEEGPQASVAAIGLRYVSDEHPGIRRKRSGKGFFYLMPDGGKLSDRLINKRLRSLAIPPAWTDVWICPDEAGHIQAIGRDAKGRKQYRYHDLFRDRQEGVKYERLLQFAGALPAIRASVAADMALRGLPRSKVLATVVHLLEATLIRIGNEDYAKQNKSYGLTTLRNRHVAIEGSEIRFSFIGKSGKRWALRVRDRRVAKIIRACHELPGQELLQYRDEEGRLHAVASSDVNAYLREITQANVTAKDFRTWAGTVLAARALSQMAEFSSPTQAKKNLRDAIVYVAARLGNTPTICRKCYIHPEIPAAYLEGALTSAPSGASIEMGGEAGKLAAEEQALLDLLRRRLG
jgi:DNA topoisomerase I